MHRAIEQVLWRAAAEVQVLSTLTPIDASKERERLVDALRHGRTPEPRWTYSPVGHDDLRRALDEAERAIEAEAAGEPLAGPYLDKIRELSVEAALCAAAGTPQVGVLARRRFAPLHASIAREASTLAAAWLAEPAEPEPADRIASDDPDDRSLLSQMRAEVGRRRLPFAVLVRPSLAPCAATGERVILIAAGRAMSERDVARTVLHEIDGHAMPRVRAAQATLALFRVGTARGVDHQEGLALVLEERHGCLDGRRRRMLAARHKAVEAMAGGASFADVAVAMHREHGFDPIDAVIVAERAFRGSRGTGPGLGRERVYLESFLQVRAHLRDRPDDEAVLASGQVAVETVDVLRAHAGPLPTALGVTGRGRER